MMAPTTWILLDSQYFVPPPPNGPLRIGTIIANPTAPLSSYFNLDLPIEESINTSVQENFHDRTESRHARLFGLLGTEHSFTELSIQQVITIESSHVSQYLDAASKARTVQSLIKEGNMFVITGLKVARGLTFEKSRQSEKWAEARVPLPGMAAAVGVPVAGVDVGGVVGNQRGITGSGLAGVPSDFVFAIRTARLRFRPQRISGNHRSWNMKRESDWERNEEAGKAKRLLKEQKDIDKLEEELAKRKQTLENERAGLGSQTSLESRQKQPAERPTEEQHSAGEHPPATDASDDRTPGVTVQNPYSITQDEQHVPGSELQTDGGDDDDDVPKRPIRPPGDEEPPNGPQHPAADNHESDQPYREPSQSLETSSASCGLSCFRKGTMESAEQRRVREKKELLDRALKFHAMDD